MTSSQRIVKFKQNEAKILKAQSLKLKFPEFSETEDIINDFSCALKKDILVHGRLFIGLECFYFYANILGFETKLMERWENVKTVSKAKLAHIIPNAIKIVSKDARYTFASFSFRNYPYELLKYTIRNYREQINLKACEIREIVKGSIFTKSERNEYIPDVEIHDLSSNNYDESFGSNSEHSTETDSSINKFSSPNTLNDNKASKKKSEGLPLLHHNSLPDIESSSLLPCCCEPYKHEIVQKLYCINIDDIFSALYDETSTIMTKVYKSQNIIDYKINSRVNNIDGSVTIESSNVLPKGFMGKSAHNKLIEVFPSSNQPNIHYQIMGKSITEGVPYADSFEILTNTCLRAKGSSQTVYSVTMEIRFKKSIFGLTKQLIEKQALKTSISIINHCVDELTKLYGLPSDIKKNKTASYSEFKNAADKNDTGNTSIEIGAFYGSLNKLNKIHQKLVFILCVALLFALGYQYCTIIDLKRRLSICRETMKEA